MGTPPSPDLYTEWERDQGIFVGGELLTVETQLAVKPVTCNPLPQLEILTQKCRACNSCIPECTGQDNTKTR